MARPLLYEPEANAIPAVMGLAKLGKMRFDDVDLAPVWQEIAGRFAEDESDVAPLMDLCILDQLLNNAERGLALQNHALAARRLYQLPAQTKTAGLRVLGFAVAGAISANTPIEFLIEGSDITLYLLYVAPGRPLPPVPEHDLAFVLIAESDTSRAVLKELEGPLADWPRPVLNRPALIPQVGRERLYRVLASLPGVEIPATVRVSLETLESVAAEEIALETVLPEGGFPLIARPLDSHGGHGLEKINDLAELRSYLSTRREAEFYLSRFVDYRSADGLYRKYRVAVIEGKAFPSHMGISSDWMIHYVNAGMQDSAEKRAEEAFFMNCFEAEFARRHGRAIAAIATATGLDYFGIDCGETPDGKLLVFEADTALVVHNMDSPDLFPYKSAPMRSLFAAFRALLYRKSAADPRPLELV